MPEKRQMSMVDAAFNHLCDKLRGGEVTADVVQKLSQLVSDLANRNFVNASAIQTVSVVISNCSRIDIIINRPIFRVQLILTTLGFLLLS